MIIKLLCILPIGNAVAYQDTAQQSDTVSVPFLSPVRSSRTTRCTKCANHRRTLRVLAKQQIDHKSVGPHSHTNYRYLTTPEKTDRLSSLHSLYVSTKKQFHRLLEKIAAFANQHGVAMEEQHDDLVEKEGSLSYLKIRLDDYFGSSSMKQLPRRTREA